MTEYEKVAMNYLKNVVEGGFKPDGLTEVALGLQAADLILKYENNRVYAEQMKAKEEIRG